MKCTRGPTSSACWGLKQAASRLRTRRAGVLGFWCAERGGGGGIAAAARRQRLTRARSLSFRSPRSGTSSLSTTTASWRPTPTVRPFSSLLFLRSRGTPLTYPPPPPPGARIDAVKQHIRNLLTPATPHYFNTLYDPYAPGADFVRVHDVGAMSDVCKTADCIYRVSGGGGGGGVS